MPAKDVEGETTLVLTCALVVFAAVSATAVVSAAMSRACCEMPGVRQVVASGPEEDRTPAAGADDALGGDREMPPQTFPLDCSSLGPLATSIG